MNYTTIHKAEESLNQLKKDKRNTDYKYASNIIKDTTRLKQLKEDIRVGAIKLEGYKQIYKGKPEQEVKIWVETKIKGEM